MDVPVAGRRTAGNVRGPAAVRGRGHLRQRGGRRERPVRGSRGDDMTDYPNGKPQDGDEAEVTVRGRYGIIRGNPFLHDATGTLVSTFGVQAATSIRVITHPSRSGDTGTWS